MNDLTTYHGILPLMRGGDVLLFDGGDRSDLVEMTEHFLPNAIEAATRSNLSHAGMILDPDLLIDGKPQAELMLIESTISHGKSGPQVNALEKRLAEYDGRVWWAPLSERTRRILDLQIAYQYGLAKVGKSHYGVKSLLDFVFRKVPLVGYLPFFHKADANPVCSELVAEMLRAGGIPGLDTHEVSPQRLGEMAIYGACVQLVGSPAKIRNFNTV